MKKVFVFILVLLAISLVSALDCQYTDLESYQERGNFLYYSDSNEYFGEGLNLSEFSDGVGVWLGDDCRPSFKINNPFSKDITLTIKYYIFASPNALHPEIKEEHNDAVTIGGYSYTKISGVLGIIGACKILPDEISYHITQPYDLVFKKGVLEKNRTICKYCNGKKCLNDGVSCISNSECGGRFCVENYCSNSEVCFVNNCNCASNEIQCTDNKKCVKKDSIEFGVKPLCNMIEECKSYTYNSILNKNTSLTSKYISSNGSCEIHPEIKVLQEQEIKINENAKKRNWIIALLIVFLSGIISLILLLIRKRKNEAEAKTVEEREKQKTLEKEKEKEESKQKTEIQKQKTLKSEIEKIEKEKEHLLGVGKTLKEEIEESKKRLKEWDIKIKNADSQAKITFEEAYRREAQTQQEKIKKGEEKLKKIGEQIKSANIEAKNVFQEEYQKEKSRHEKIIQEGNDKLSRLKNQVKNASDEAKKAFEEEYQKEEQRQQERKAKLSHNDREISRKEEDQQRKREELERSKSKLNLEKDAFDSENKGFMIKKAKDKYEQRYHNQLIFEENSGYLKFKSSNEYLHRYLYRKNFGIEKGYFIHHIDANKLNCELHNLISILKERHDSFNHARVLFNDWNSGIQQLKEQLGMKDEDFPEHIRKHLKEIT